MNINNIGKLFFSHYYVLDFLASAFRLIIYSGTYLHSILFKIFNGKFDTFHIFNTIHIYTYRIDTYTYSTLWQFPVQNKRFKIIKSVEIFIKAIKATFVKDYSFNFNKSSF